MRLYYSLKIILYFNMSDDNLIYNRFKLLNKIGQGSFGDVYIGKDIKKNRDIAIKRERRDKKYILKHEFHVYKAIQTSKSKNKPRIPHVFWYGCHDGYQVLVMEYLGNSLETLLNKYCKGYFSIKTTFMLAIQILDQLALLHCMGYIHRDIKPENFLMGVGDNDRNVYMVDLGLAKEFKKKSHIKELTGKNLVGTARYSSSNSHKGIELSRRDDLESLGYLLIYFMKGSLPWQGLQAKSKSEKYRLIGEKKINIDMSELCQDLPETMILYMNYVKNLKFKERPDYYYLRNLFVDWFNTQGIDYDFYDWDRVK
jgi:serine/threonine protein kinase